MFVLLLLACANSVTEEMDSSECPEDVPTWDSAGHTLMQVYCLSCHSASSVNRQGAPEGVNFDEEREVWDRADDVLDRANTLYRLDPRDLELLTLWLTCGEPS